MRSEVLANDENIGAVLNLLHLISHPNNSKVFISAKDGVRFDYSTVSKLGMSKKQFYKALCQLKSAKLIEKNDRIYLHTTFGRIVYERNILDTSAFYQHITETKIIDVLKQVKGLSTEDITKLTDHVFSKASELGIFGEVVVPVFSYDAMVSELAKLIQLCKHEVLIATRVSPEAIINALLLKSKEGVQVRILADVNLIQQYFDLRGRDFETNSIHDRERANVIGDPWYPNTKVKRRITRVPFGMVVIDGKRAGVELVDANRPREFTAGVMINDVNFALRIKSMYEQIWEEASSNIISKDI